MVLVPSPQAAEPRPESERFAVLAILPALIPSTLIGVVKPLRQLHLEGALDARVTLEHFATEADLRWADAVLFCRNQRPRYQRLLERLAELGTPFLYDLDDDLFEIPGDVLPEAERAGRAEQMRRYLAAAHLVRVYSPALAEKVAPLSRRVEVVPASLDWSLVTETPPPRDPRRVRIVYVTSRLDDTLSARFLPAVEALARRHPGRVEFTFWGSRPPRLSRIPGVRTRRLDLDYDRFLWRLSRDGFDIGLAPLPDDAFHRCKTNIKFREYGACRIAGIYSDVEVYSSSVTDGETGLLVSDEPGAWSGALERLLGDPGLRARIQESARARVRERHSQTAAARAWLAQIEDAVRGQPRAPRRPAPAAGPEDAAPLRMLRRAGRLPALGRRLVQRLRLVGLSRTLTETRLHAQGALLLRRVQRELAAPREPAAG